VRRLLRPAEDYDDWKLNQRPLAAGDVGTLLDILHAVDVEPGYAVEASAPDGTTIWLSIF